MTVRTSEYEITEAMMRYGGSFVAQLGRLMRLADEDNKQRLFKAFPEYIQQYDAIAWQHAEQSR
jgi:hypothetical protein